jgi:hypothetical protein
MRPILKLVEGLNLQKLDDNELSEKYKQCVHAFDDLKTYRQAHMVSQAILAEQQRRHIEALTIISKSQLESANAMADEAKATSEISRMIFALTLVLALLTYYLAIPVIKEIGFVQTMIPIGFLAVLYAFLCWKYPKKR